MKGKGKGNKVKGKGKSHDDKYTDKFQDFFSQEDAKTDLIFNKAPVKVESKKKSVKKTEKKRKRIEDPHEEEAMGEGYKMVKKDGPFQDEETFMGTLQYKSFSDYFLMNKAWYSSLVKIPKLV